MELASLNGDAFLLPFKLLENNVYSSAILQILPNPANPLRSYLVSAILLCSYRISKLCELVQITLTNNFCMVFYANHNC